MRQEKKSWVKVAILGAMTLAWFFVVVVWESKMISHVKLKGSSIERTVKQRISSAINQAKGQDLTIPTPHLIRVDYNGKTEEKAGYPLKDSDIRVLISAMRRGRFEPNSFLASYRFVSILGGVNAVGIKTNNQVVFSDKMPLLKTSGNSVSIFWPTSHVVKIHEGLGLLFFSPEDTFIININEALEIAVYDSKDILAPRVSSPDDSGTVEIPRSERL